jgi:hypothetical protein
MRLTPAADWPDWLSCFFQVSLDLENFGILIAVYVFLETFLCIKLCEVCVFGACLMVPCGFDWCDKVKYYVPQLRFQFGASKTHLFEICTGDGDTTAPITGTVTWTQNIGNSVLVKWTGYDEPESEIEKYELSMGTGEGKSDLMPAMLIDADLEEFTLEDSMLPRIADATTVCFTVTAVNKENLKGASSLCGIYDSGPPLIVGLVDGITGKDIDSQSSTDSLGVSWDAFTDVSKITDVTWAAGSDNPDDIQEFRGFDLESTNALRASGLSLEHDVTYFITICLSDSLEYNHCYTTDGVTVDLTPPTQGAIACMSSICKRIRTRIYIYLYNPQRELGKLF